MPQLVVSDETALVRSRTVLPLSFLVFPVSSFIISLIQFQGDFNEFSFYDLFQAETLRLEKPGYKISNLSCLEKYLATM
jgi:hypothetical protein